MEDISAHESQTSQTAPVGLSTVSSAAPGAHGPTSSPETTQHPPHLQPATRFAPRESSSSIASNLAKARGIPGRQQRMGALVSPAISAHHADGRFSNDQAISKPGTETPRVSLKSGQYLSTLSEPPSRPSWTPPVPVAEKDDHRTDGSEAAASDAPFQQFYSAFESLISKISAPLAFTGLPLGPTAPTAPPPAKVAKAPPTKAKETKPPLPTIPVSADSLDYSQLISQAALRAVRDGVPSSKLAESFYVVPTTGGTSPYAEIMKRTDREISRHSRQLSNISEDNDDFVDARESVPSPVATKFSAPGSAAHSRRGSARSSKDVQKVAGKTMEELALENQMLRQYLDSTSKRLRVFELSAQSSSAALAQSIRSLQRSPAPTPENSRGKGEGNSDSGRSRGDDTARARIAELEEILRKNDRELQRRDKANAKLKDVVARYRDKW